MSCRLNRCCCFNNSEDASFASAVYTAITSAIAIIYLSVNLGYPLNNAKDNIISYIVGLFVQLLLFLVSILLFYAVKKRNRMLMIPWMVWMIIDLIMQFVGVVIICIAFFHLLVPVVLIFLLIVLALIGLNIICFIVVNTHYHALASMAQPVVNELGNYEKVISSV